MAWWDNAVSGAEQVLTQNAANDSNKYSTQVAQSMSGLGQGTWGDVATQEKFAGDVIDMESAGRHNTGRITLPSGVGAGDFSALLTEGEAFAASAGWEFAPTADQYNAMMRSGLAGADQATVFKWLAQTNGVASKMPWAAAGMTHTKYNESLQAMGDAIENYTGDRSMHSDLQAQAIQEGWSTSRLENELLKNPKYQAGTPWLKYGLTYKGWKDYKQQNKGIAQQRFGASTEPTEAQYAQVFEDSAPKQPQAGSAVNIQSGTSALVQPGSKSSVR